jgi:hypothetical protein
MNDGQRHLAAAGMLLLGRLVSPLLFLSIQSTLAHQTGTGNSLCDFDRKWSYETVACSRWTATIDGEGETPGFVITKRRQIPTPEVRTFQSPRTISTACNDSELASGWHFLLMSLIVLWKDNALRRKIYNKPRSLYKRRCRQSFVHNSPILRQTASPTRAFRCCSGSAAMQSQTFTTDSKIIRRCPEYF